MYGSGGRYGVWRYTVEGCKLRWLLNNSQIEYKITCEGNVQDGRQFLSDSLSVAEDCVLLQGYKRQLVQIELAAGGPR